ncbi:MAG: hypothetical protein ACKO7Y_05935 [Candidatus Nitrosotenuis sp.]
MKKIIFACVAIFALLGAVLTVPMMQHADAQESKADKKADKKETTKETKKSTGKPTSTATVEIKKGSSDSESCAKGNKCYSSFETTVKKGGTVTWINKDSGKHTITSGNIMSGPDGNFDSGIIEANGKFSQKFDKAGTYEYFDIIRPWMKGKVVVS